MRYVIGLMAVLWCALAAPGQAQAEKRVALVIGNASYGHHAGLPNVPNDAAAMAALFKAAKFDSLDMMHNLGVAELRRALRLFAVKAADADVAVLFYAGHGIEVGQENYLIPVDARLATDFDVKDETVSLDRVLEAMEPARRLRLVILDACRENPFVKSMKRTSATRSVGRGLVRVEPTIADTLIAFATKPNAVAADGKGPNSPFTAALVKHLLTPGLDLRIALGNVRDEVLAATGKRQEPYVTSSLGGGIVSIVPGSKTAAPPTPAPVPSEAAEAWAAVKDTTSIAQLEVISTRYKGTVYADLAQARIAELRKLALEAPSGPKTARPSSVPPAPNEVDDWFIPVLTAADERALKPGDRFKDCFKESDHCPMMVVVSAGSFMMGSPPGEEGRFDNEGPQHRVIIARPFAVGKFEVTFAEWDACVAASGCQYAPSDAGWGRGTRPVMNVSWEDITKEYLPWLSRKTGKVYRQLTEAEWEYAARAGTTTPFSTGRTITPTQANFDATSQTMSVGLFPPNAFGLHDMHGNVWEWLQDCWNRNYSDAPADASAWTAGDCSFRVIRGGSWVYGSRLLRSANRRRHPTHTRYSEFGFRFG